MRLLLTGATGFIGEALLRRLKLRHEVFVIVRNEDQAETLSKMATPVVWDMSARLQIEKLPKTVDGIFHLAASRNFRSFPEHVDEMTRVNINATIELLEYARLAEVRGFVLATTGNAYAFDKGLHIGERPTPPNDFYTATKVACEHLARPYRALYPVSVLRLFFPYGQGQVDKTIPRLIARVRNGQPIELEGGAPGSSLSLTYVDDLVDAMETAISEGWSGMYDVASPEKTTVQSIVEEIGRQIGLQPILSASSAPANHIEANLSSLARVYDLRRFRDFSAGLALVLSRSGD